MSSYYFTPERKMATDKQITFARKLAAERNIEFLADGTLVNDDKEMQALPRDVMSAQIDLLLAAPRPKSATPAVEQPSAPVDGLDLSALRGGYYAATFDGITKFFKVDVVEDGKWGGWVFVKIQASDELHRQGSQKPGQAYRGASEDYLRAIVADEQAASTLYGREIGRCGICGRTLTDEDSRARGIGPICAEKMGW